VVFTNLEILNLSNNRISDIEPLKNLSSLKIIDLRFNRIKRLPSWIFTGIERYIGREGIVNQEGIFLEGNPLDRRFILSISEIELQAIRGTGVRKRAEVL